MDASGFSKSRKRGLRILSLSVILILVGLVAIGWYASGPFIHRIIQAKLQEMVSDHLNAKLEMGRIQYDYPFGVTVHDVALVTPYQEKPLVLASFKELRLQLTRLPFKQGPLQIERIDIDSPTIHLIRTTEGFVGQQDLIRSEKERESLEAPVLSEMFQLKHLQITGGTVMYEDHRLPDQTPLAWRDLNVVLDTYPQDASYAFNFTGSSGRLASIAGEGQIDLDTWVTDLKAFSVQTRIDPDETESSLPPEVTQWLNQYQLRGNAQLQLSGRLLLNQWQDSQLNLALKIENAMGIYPEFPDPLQDLDINISGTYVNSSANLQLDYFSARSGSTGISVSRCNVLVNRKTMQWTASPLRVAVAYVPTQITRSVLDQPATLFVVAKATQLDSPTEVSVDLTGSSLTLPNLNDELKLECVVDYRGDSVVIRPSVLNGLGGRTTFDGWYHVPTRLAELKSNVESLSLSSLRTLLIPTKDRQLEGRLNAQFSARVTGTDPRTLIAYGKARVSDGVFARVPVLSNLASFLRIGEGFFVARSAFTRFRVEDQTVYLERISTSTNAVRVRGDGKIGFDRSLDLRLFVVGSGDWAQGVRQTGIPLISDLGGLLAGGAQRVVSGVASQFTTVRVRGTLDDPKIIPDPAPVITDPIRKLFESEE